MATPDSKPGAETDSFLGAPGPGHRLLRPAYRVQGTNSCSRTDRQREGGDKRGKGALGSTDKDRPDRRGKEGREGVRRPGKPRHIKKGGGREREKAAKLISGQDARRGGASGAGPVRDPRPSRCGLKQRPRLPRRPAGEARRPRRPPTGPRDHLPSAPGRRSRAAAAHRRQRAADTAGWALGVSPRRQHRSGANPYADSAGRAAARGHGAYGRKRGARRLR
ncbi:unnamed protein product [Rangifer tarandus platyrhynchus]|uniref:Uncharacterized protein n=2 Tax=Rangifer tarandus platyrhynchus TaxID=3082113 RepID=A0ABN8XWW2_RANTA|nr:unnamed protein product [Rangifer tarandus platyrhynchus]CAI9713539.1 unnamed protein product [Rangifer tarandus platyrhynchus]